MESSRKSYYNIIKYHNNPLAAPDDVKEIVKMIYLSHFITRKMSGKDIEIDYEDIVLNQSNIKSESDLNEFLNYTKLELNRKK